jgi:membrane-bound serine protease (ClpP class)
MSVSFILGVFAAKAIILFFLGRLIYRSYRSRINSGESRMIGLKGKALTEVAPEGRVIVQGEYWWARSRARITEGENVCVIGIDGLTLEIEPSSDKAVIPKPVSAIDHQGLQEKK